MDSLRAHPLDDQGHEVLLGRLPDALVPDDSAFEALWDLHPEGFHEIMIHGCLVKTPRWQQAYGEDYHYTGQVNRALPVAPEMEAMFDWFKEALDARLNGLLFNWYDGAHDHYIGAHRDSTTGMLEGAPIVTPWHREELLDLLDGQRVSRKLKPAEVSVRRAMVEHIRPFLHAAIKLPVSLEFPELRTETKRTTVEAMGRSSVGTQTLKTWMLFRLIYDSWDNREYSGWRMGSFGMSGAGISLEPHVEVDDGKAREAVQWFKDMGVRFGKPYLLLMSDDRVSDETKEWFSSLQP